MEKEKDDILLKVRSSRGCISAGYRLYTGRFKHIFRYSWVAALIYALFCSVSGAMMIMVPTMIPITAAILIIVECLFASYGYSVLKQHQTLGNILRPVKWFSIDTHIFIRTIKCWLCVLVVYLIASVIIVGLGFVAFKYLALYTAIGCTALVLLVVLCLLLPLTYITMRYILNDGIGFWKQFKIGYGVGMRRWGFIFIVVLVACIVEILLMLLLSLPATILSMANTQSMFGVAMGDPYALPSYMPALAAGTFLIIGFLQAYVMLSVLFPIYYMYGSIDAQEQEKQDFNKQQQ
ncbi:MAG: hypothetical protein J6Q22_17355 [Prevotella sp.]|jgi:hypothetical protein|nr:hypothetical protein [Prevotella sp.]